MQTASFKNRHCGWGEIRLWIQSEQTQQRCKFQSTLQHRTCYLNHLAPNFEIETFQIWIILMFFCFFLDPWAEAEGTRSWRQVQKAGPEEGESLRGWDDESSPGLQTQGLHGPQSQPQVCEEGGRQTGQGIKTISPLELNEVQFCSFPFFKLNDYFLPNPPPPPGAHHWSGWLA